VKKGRNQGILSLQEPTYREKGQKPGYLSLSEPFYREKWQKPGYFKPFAVKKGRK
jgi:hypothetical protein